MWKSKSAVRSRKMNDKIKVSEGEAFLGSRLFFKVEANQVGKFCVLAAKSGLEPVMTYSGENKGLWSVEAATVDFTNEKVKTFLQTFEPKGQESNHFDFGKLMVENSSNKAGLSDDGIPAGMVDATFTTASGTVTEKQIRMEILPRNEGKDLSLRFDGGPTGHESYHLDGYFVRVLQSELNGDTFCICAGTNGWDKCVVDRKQVLSFVNDHAPDISKNFHDVAGVAIKVAESDIAKEIAPGVVDAVESGSSKMVDFLKERAEQVKPLLAEAENLSISYEKSEDVLRIESASMARAEAAKGDGREFVAQYIRYGFSMASYGNVERQNEQSKAIKGATNEELVEMMGRNSARYRELYDKEATIRLNHAVQNDPKWTNIYRKKVVDGLSSGLPRKEIDAQMLGAFKSLHFSEAQKLASIGRSNPVGLPDTERNQMVAINRGYNAMREQYLERTGRDVGKGILLYSLKGASRIDLLSAMSSRDEHKLQQERSVSAEKSSANENKPRQMWGRRAKAEGISM
jgi:hypothetical protein